MKYANLYLQVLVLHPGQRYFASLLLHISQYTLEFAPFMTAPPIILMDRYTLIERSPQLLLFQAFTPIFAFYPKNSCPRPTFTVKIHVPYACSIGL